MKNYYFFWKKKKNGEISLNTIREKLHIINDYWNKYYFSKKIFQKKINFTEDIKTNYYADLNNYFLDTLDLIREFEPINDRNDYISKSIVLLQTIYVHQDLMDELLYIFKLKRSEHKDKEPNRGIRNELIGHPIRKRRNVLNSSILFAFHKELSNDIKYTKYSSDNNFRPESKEYNVKNIIENHKIFLELYLDKIIQKSKKEILQYNKDLASILNIPIEQQFDFIDNFDKELLSNIDYIFEKNSLEYYYKNQDKHARYRYAIKYYLKTLNSILNESKGIYNRPSSTKHYVLDNYAIEQLYKKDKHFNIDFYIKYYKDNPEILEELIHMKKNITTDMEYYVALRYLASIKSDKME